MAERVDFAETYEDYEEIYKLEYIFLCGFTAFTRNRKRLRWWWVLLIVEQFRRIVDKQCKLEHGKTQGIKESSWRILRQKVYRLVTCDEIPLESIQN